MNATSIRTAVAKPHTGAVEIGGLAALYALYEVVRGFGSEDWAAAHAHTDAIVSLEQKLGLFAEGAIQNWTTGLGFLPALLGIAYIALHFLGTATVLVWVHRSHRSAFPAVRTTLIVSTALALVGYILYPAAPPRLADLGFADTVSSHTGLNLSSDLLGSLYNPIAAVPSLHFGYSVIAGAAVFALARHRVIRWIGAAYPLAMLFIIVATGNHFFFDAAAGGLVVLAGWLVSKALVSRA
jgi:hypothetical protein